MTGAIDLRMAWRNLWRNGRRTVLTMCAISFACVVLILMLSFQFGSYETMINSAVKKQSGHLQVQAEGYQEHRKMRRVVADPGPVRRALDQDAAVEAVSSRAEAFSLLSSERRSFGGLVIGVEPAGEASVSSLEDLVRDGSYLDPSVPDGALVGVLLARRLQVGLDDDVTVLGQGRDGSIAATIVRVRGLVRSGVDELDRSVVYVPLRTFQETYAMRGAVHRVVAIARSLGAVGGIETRVRQRLSALEGADDLAVLDWRALNPGLVQGITVDLASGVIFWLILVVVVAFSIFNTFLMAVLERTREFGVLLALGTSPGRITRLLLLESFALTLVGVGVGTAAGCAVTLWLQSVGIDLAGASDLFEQYGISGRIYPSLSVVTAVAGPVVVIVITALAALVPALRVRRLRAVRALAHG